MRSFEIPGTGVKTSELCIGTDYYGKTIPEETAFRLLDMYRDAGGITIDTAHVYSDYLPGAKHASEKTIGKWLKQRVCREKLTIATKGGFPDLDDRTVSRLGRDEIRSDLEESLRCLGVDHVDIYWLHRDDPEKTVEELTDTLEEFRKEGLIRCWGLSNYSPGRMREALKICEKRKLAKPPVQIKWGLALTAKGAEYDPSLQEMSEEYYAFLRETGTVLFAYGAQAKGFFSKLCEEENGVFTMEPGKCKDRYFCEENIELFRQLKAEAGPLGMRPAALALRKMLEAPFPVALIAGSRTPEQMKLTLEAVN